MSFLRVFIISIFLTLSVLSPSWAQSSSQDVAEQVPATAELPPAEVPAPTPQVDDTPIIDLDDPAIKAALAARDQADKALADAVRAQRDNAAANNGTLAETPDVKKKSLIPSNAEEVKALANKIWAKIIGWLTSLPFLAQLSAIVAAYLLAPIFAGIARKSLFFFKAAPQEGDKLLTVRNYIYRARKLLRPIFLVGLLALAAVILKAVPAAGQAWLVKLAQGLAVVLLLHAAIKEFITNDLVRKIATWTVLPVALMMVFGFFDDFTNALNGAELMNMGGTPITLMTVILLLIFGGIFFKLGNMLNAKGQDAIRSQDGMDATTQEVIAKLFQIVLFIIVFVLVLGAAKVPLSGLVVIFSALSLGIGLGLQPIAANFVSGLIILFDRTVQVGDYVVLPDGQEGFVDAINMRSTIVETTDGKDIMVPNTTWTDSAYENWTHKDPRQRYEVYFTVAFDTDIDTLEDMLIPAISKHPSVLQEPEEPDLELREFGEYGIKFAIEFWCSGIDDGPNKFTSDLNFIVWRTLRDNKIEIPLPQRVITTLK